MKVKSVLPRVIVFFVLLWAAAGIRIGQTAEHPELRPRPNVAWDTFSDTWAATDALGRRVPTYEDVGPPRADRVVGIFYFLWHGAHVHGGPYDVTKILAQDPQAMLKRTARSGDRCWLRTTGASRFSAIT